MSSSVHTYGQTCHLTRNISHTGTKGDDDIPYLKAQYFYYATYSVDDPLSAVPIPTGADTKPTQYSPLPFSARDNNTLEEAWLGVSTERDKKIHKVLKDGHGNGKSASENQARETVEDGNMVGIGGSNRLEPLERQPRATSREGHLTIDREGDLETDHLTSKDDAYSGFSQGQNGPRLSMQLGGRLGYAGQDSSSLISRTRQGQFRAPDDGMSDDFQKSAPLRIQKPVNLAKDISGGSPMGSLPSSLPQGNAGTTGSPFVKLPERSASPRPRSSRLQDSDFQSSRPASPPTTHLRDSTDTASAADHECKSRKKNKTHSDVPVGVSRLYLVELPSLLMKPIYWAHVHDAAPVIRATWFYKESMLPVEPVVANQLEMGYRELRPWSQTWNDELASAVEVGAAGEEKIAHQLWPTADLLDPKKHQLSADPECAAKCFRGEAAAEGNLEEEDVTPGTKIAKKKYPNAQVIYKDGQVAFILKPNLQPSAYYGRKPLQKIRKGRVVGIQVVRGFDRNVWEKLHPPKKTVVAPKVAAKVPVSGITESATSDFCPACKAQEETPNVTDLCLVIHGIGQKLSERVESFNFTHACNSVRRSVNVELGTDAVKKVLRKDLGGIMVLPINWRSNLSFEDGGLRQDGDKDEEASDFTLKEITPGTIPAVRNLISDVMLDIPFYMSHHKEKMIQAVVREANRVYRLWCKNNPGFHNNGRVHIIAHSLGSTMALEILSKQPTEIDSLDLSSKKLNTKYFDFNTTNLFCAGSPAGFFLLLERSKLIPRKGRNKPGADLGDDQDEAIVGEVGTFGCLAVDNIYNVMHCNDPIAYRLNATVDPQYAASLKEAHVPSATIGFFEGFGNAMRSVTPGLAPPIDLVVGQVPKPPLISRLPSQLEMEVHDFTREEIAEKKFYLLNDNSQIDWLLSSGGGPFDIAYLDMLGAHSSYWEKKEFIRLLVTEVGREPGKRTTLPNMRAQKMTFKG